MLRNRLQLSPFFASVTYGYFPMKSLLRGSACSETVYRPPGALLTSRQHPFLFLIREWSQYAQKSIDIVVFSQINYYYARDAHHNNTFHSDIGGGQHPPYCHACLHVIPDVNFKILSVLGGQHAPCYPH
jgi:hypothetical protein